MSDIKHTPGPWRVQDRYLTIFTTDDPKTGTGSSNAIATVLHRGNSAGSVITSSETQANARLIAASPELFAAAVDMLDCIDRHDWQSLDPSDLRDAVAKVEVKR